MPTKHFPSITTPADLHLVIIVLTAVTKVIIIIIEVEPIAVIAHC